MSGPSADVGNGAVHDTAILPAHDFVDDLVEHRGLTGLAAWSAHAAVRLALGIAIGFVAARIVGVVARVAKRT